MTEVCKTHKNRQNATKNHSCTRFEESLPCRHVGISDENGGDTVRPISKMRSDAPTSKFIHLPSTAQRDSPMWLRTAIKRLTSHVRNVLLTFFTPASTQKLENKTQSKARAQHSKTKPHQNSLALGSIHHAELIRKIGKLIRTSDSRVPHESRRLVQRKFGF